MILQTKRLLLSPFELTDAPEVQQLAGAIEVARYTAAIPHPYPDGVAEEWILTSLKEWHEKKRYTFALKKKDDKQLVGTITLSFRKKKIAEIGYWIGVSFWNQGYTTEAAEKVIQYGFEELGLHRIYGQSLTRNPGSMRVMEKLGFQREGTLREHAFRWEKYEDLATYGLLIHEWKGDQII